MSRAVSAVILGVLLLPRNNVLGYPGMPRAAVVGVRFGVGR
jgi:hypothetical protein